MGERVGGRGGFSEGKGGREGGGRELKAPISRCNAAVTFTRAHVRTCERSTADIWNSAHTFAQSMHNFDLLLLLPPPSPPLPPSPRSRLPLPRFHVSIPLSCRAFKRSGLNGLPTPRAAGFTYILRELHVRCGALMMRPRSLRARRKTVVSLFAYLYDTADTRFRATLIDRGKYSYFAPSGI